MTLCLQACQQALYQVVAVGDSRRQFLHEALHLTRQIGKPLASQRLGRLPPTIQDLRSRCQQLGLAIPRNHSPGLKIFANTQ